MKALLNPAKPTRARNREITLNRFDLDVVAQARQFIRDCGTALALPQDIVDTAVSCVSELATNAVVHAVWPADWWQLVVRVRLDAAAVVVEVDDHDPNPAVVVSMDDDALEAAISALKLGDELHGLGLASVVANLSDLDYVPTDHGKTGRAVIALGGSGSPC